MPVIALTDDPQIFEICRTHFARYGLAGFLHWRRTPEIAAARTEIEFSPDSVNLLFSMTSSLFREGEIVALERPWARPDHADLAVRHEAHAQVLHRNARGVVETTHHDILLPGKIDLTGQGATGLDEDVFRAGPVAQKDYATGRNQGRINALGLILDQIIFAHLPPFGISAPQEPKRSLSGLLTLQHSTPKPAGPVDFDELPHDFLRSHPLFRNSGILDAPAGRLLLNALSRGAHFRTSISPRDWFFWSEGPNAGIPLVASPSVTEEIVALTEHASREILPPLIPDVPGGDAEGIILARRMVSEVLALVIADMAVMDAALDFGWPAIPGRGAARQIFQALRGRVAKDADSFLAILKSTVPALLWGDDRDLRDCAGDRLVDRFHVETAARLRGACDREVRRLEDLRLSQKSQEAWAELIPNGILPALGLMSTSGFLISMEGISPDLPCPDLLRQVFDRVLAFEIQPLLQPRPLPGHEEIRSNAIKRYLVGQLALYARQGERLEAASALPMINKALSEPILNKTDLTSLRAAYLTDLKALERCGLLTSLEVRIHTAACPVFEPHYPTLAAPGLPSIEDGLRRLRPEKPGGPTP